jgi:hypothetical protein
MSQSKCFFVSVNPTFRNCSKIGVYEVFWIGMAFWLLKYIMERYLTNQVIDIKPVVFVDNCLFLREGIVRLCVIDNPHIPIVNNLGIF